MSFLNLKLTSQFSILKMSLGIFDQVISWHRQVYNASNFEPTDLFSSFKFTYNYRSIQIFVTFDKFTWFNMAKKDIEPKNV